MLGRYRIGPATISLGYTGVEHQRGHHHGAPPDAGRWPTRPAPGGRPRRARRLDQMVYHRQLPLGASRDAAAQRRLPVADLAHRDGAGLSRRDGAGRCATSVVAGQLVATSRIAKADLRRLDRDLASSLTERDGFVGACGRLAQLHQRGRRAVPPDGRLAARRGHRAAASSISCRATIAARSSARISYG
jgi:hypothetical protein